jgi:outer membrane protein assembly complex protein YaeT
LKRVLFLILCFGAIAQAALLPLKFTGNHAIDDRTLYEVVGLKKPYFFEFWKGAPKIDETKVAPLLRMVENYYRSRGFYHARATEFQRDGNIIIKIDENAPILVANVATISQIPIEDLILFHLHDRFDPMKFVESKKNIRARYAKAGYCNVELNAKAFVDIEKNLAYLVYDVTPHNICHFGSVNVHTPSNVDEAIIRSMLYFKEGDTYTTEKIKESYKEIYANEGIDRVTINDTRHKGDVVPIEVSVSVHPKPIHFSAGAGVSSDEGITLQTGIKHRNFLGDLRTVGIEARYSEVKEYLRLSGDMPLRNHYRLGALAGVSEEHFDGYDARSLSMKANLIRKVMKRSWEAALIYDDTTTSNSRDPVNFPNGNVRLLSPLAAWDLDMRDSMMEPTRGYRLHGEFTGALKALLSDATYYKITLTAAWHKPMGESVFSTRLKFGTIKSLQGKIPPSYRFYAGGMNSNRAYGYRQLGPKNSYGDPIGSHSITEASIEYRYPLSAGFKAVLFSDATWLSSEAMPDFSDATIAVGPGIRYITPIGPLAIDVGFDTARISQYAIHFHIGELF